MSEYNQFKWVDTFVNDFETGKRFYSELFGWEFTDQFDGDQLVYSLANLKMPDDPKQSAAVAGVGPCQFPNPGGIPWNWGVYILIENLESTIARVVEAGGKICKEPMNVMGAGRMAVCADSSGAIFHLWQPLAHSGAGIEKVPGAYCWFELISSDIQTSEAFYHKVFGWTVSETDINGNPYWGFKLDGVGIAGMHTQIEETGGQTLWLPYFQSTDLDSQIETSHRLGGSVVFGPTAIPGYGRYAILSDPEQNMFGINEPE